MSLYSTDNGCGEEGVAAKEETRFPRGMSKYAGADESDGGGTRFWLSLMAEKLLDIRAVFAAKASEGDSESGEDGVLDVSGCASNIIQEEYKG